MSEKEMALVVKGCGGLREISKHIEEEMSKDQYTDQFRSKNNNPSTSSQQCSMFC